MICILFFIDEYYEVIFYDLFSNIGYLYVIVKYD